jgi:hypothetical protein
MDRVLQPVVTKAPRGLLYSGPPLLPHSIVFFITIDGCDRNIVFTCNLRYSSFKFTSYNIVNSLPRSKNSRMWTLSRPHISPRVEKKESTYHYSHSHVCYHPVHITIYLLVQISDTWGIFGIPAILDDTLDYNIGNWMMREAVCQMWFQTSHNT